MVEVQVELRALREAVGAQHETLREHAAREEKMLEANVRNVDALTQEISKGTASQMRLADIAEEREKREQEDRAARRKLELAQVEQRGKVGSWFQTQWDKWGMVIVGATIITVAPGAAPYLMQLVGLSAQQVTVVQAAPVAVQPVPAGESNP
jgi:(p)ppGpp synthase/HD superfamily hydrolase